MTVIYLIAALCGSASQGDLITRNETRQCQKTLVLCYQRESDLEPGMKPEDILMDCVLES